MRTAQQSAQKFVDRAAVAGPDYLAGAQGTPKDQSARAQEAAPIYKAALTASFAKDSYKKGLAKSGKQGWLDGVTKKGVDRYATGVAVSAGKYATESGRYDGARASSDNMPRGVKGSPQNLAKVSTVVNALRAVKTA